MFSAFMLDPVHGWIATHRLPLDSAIRYCQEYRVQHFDCPVALVPDGEDPDTILRLAHSSWLYYRRGELVLALLTGLFA